MHTVTVSRQYTFAQQHAEGRACDPQVRATEAQELEAEAEKRRKRIEAWQALKRKQADDEAQANGERARPGGTTPAACGQRCPGLRFFASVQTMDERESFVYAGVTWTCAAAGEDEKAKAWTWDDESDDDEMTQAEPRVATQASAAAPMDALATAADGAAESE